MHQTRPSAPFLPLLFRQDGKEGAAGGSSETASTERAPRYARSLLFSEPVSSSFPPNRFAGFAGNKVHSINFNVSRET